MTAHPSAPLAAALYERHFDRVRAYAYAIVRDREEARDIAQETFLRALVALPGYEDRGVPIEAWLLRIAHNIALTDRERAARLTLTPEPSPADGAAGGTPRADWIEDPELLDLVDALPRAQRQVLVLRFLADLTREQTATALERSPGAVRGLQQRALATLCERFRLSDRDRAPVRSSTGSAAA